MSETVGPDPERYVPAAGRFGLTALYDTTVGLTMREEAWRPALAHAATADAQDGDVLDVGCGTGAVTHALALAAPDARVTGLDGDPGVLARARRRLAGCPGVTLLEGRADDLPFEDGAFDRVTCALLLHHLSPATQRAALSEAARVLRPGGNCTWPTGVARAARSGPRARCCCALSTASRTPDRRYTANCRGCCARRASYAWPSHGGWGSCGERWSSCAASCRHQHRDPPKTAQ